MKTWTTVLILVNIMMLGMGCNQRGFLQANREDMSTQSLPSGSVGKDNQKQPSQHAPNSKNIETSLQDSREGPVGAGAYVSNKNGATIYTTPNGKAIRTLKYNSGCSLTGVQQQVSGTAWLQLPDNNWVLKKDIGYR